MLDCYFSVIIIATTISIILFIMVHSFSCYINCQQYRYCTDHGSQRWTSCSVCSQLSRIDRKFDWRVEATPIHPQLHWLPIRQRTTLKMAVLTYKVHATATPDNSHYCYNHMTLAASCSRQRCRVY